MKKIYLLMLLVLAFTMCSCSTEDQETLRPSVDTANLTIDFNKEIDFVSIRVNNAQGISLETTQFQNVYDIRLNISEGQELMIFTIDEADYEYNYMLSKDNTVLLQGNHKAEESNTLILNYNL